jgi:hypothetical protein
MSTNAYIFECSTATYLDCVQKGLFGSNLPWPLQIKKGDHCCLYHYEVGTLFALWQAVSNGGKNLVPKAWGGTIPVSGQSHLGHAGNSLDTEGGDWGGFPESHNRQIRQHNSGATCGGTAPRGPEGIMKATTPTCIEPVVNERMALSRRSSDHCRPEYKFYV